MDNSTQLMTLKRIVLECESSPQIKPPLKNQGLKMLLSDHMTPEVSVQWQG